MAYEQEKAAVVRVTQAMYRSGMTNLFEGNVSMRVGDVMLLTPSQQDKELLTPDMILELDLDGNVLYALPGLKPSVEYGMHALAYRVRPDIRAVVHEHSACATAFAMAGKPIASEGFAELNILFGEIPVAPYGLSGTEAIYAGVAPLLEDHNVILLEGHGVLAVGPDVITAYGRAEAVEKIAKTLILSRMMGGEKPLPPGELEKARQQCADRFRAETGR